MFHALGSYIQPVRRAFLGGAMLAALSLSLSTGAQAANGLVDVSGIGGPRTTQEVPEALRGLWAWPDCAQEQHVVNLSDYFHYMSEKSQMFETGLNAGFKISDIPGRISQIETVREYGELFLIYTTAPDIFIVRKTNDGVLELAYARDASVINNIRNVSGDTDALWQRLAASAVKEYTACAPDYVASHSDYLDQLADVGRLDQIFHQCQYGMHRYCRDFLFDLADLDDNGRIGQDELHYAYDWSSRMAGTLNSRKSKTFADHILYSDDFVMSALFYGDEDLSRDLDRDEIYRFLDRLPELKNDKDISFDYFTQAVHNIAQIFPHPELMRFDIGAVPHIQPRSQRLESRASDQASRAAPVMQSASSDPVAFKGLRLQ